MSRAFVKESDNDPAADLPDRPVSEFPNFVTAEGLALIDAELATLQVALEKAGDDMSQRAKVERDLRYWRARHASAEVIPPPEDHETVRFGATVTFVREDGREQTFRIVGEDEADPARGTLSYVAPLARALTGKRIGDTVTVADNELEITAIR